MDNDTHLKNAFLTWFRAHGGNVHSAVSLTTFPVMGQGMIALHDINKDTILFTLPRSLTLSLRNSRLPTAFGEQAWRQYGLHKGWVGLILCILWEAAAGHDGKWGGYLCSLPDSFETPMFWSESDLQELEGTSIVGKIGKAEAEKDYYEKLLPAVMSRRDIFPSESREFHYSLQKYHITGSLILSRSFHVEKWSGDTGGDNSFEHTADHMSASSDVNDASETGVDENASAEVDEVSSDDDDEDPADVAMVPMADILNARYGTMNAKLCYESEDLQMISTRAIKAGEQIWNTYGDPPNSDLLRRYGHVDLVPMSDGSKGNPGDIVEIRANLVVDVLRESATSENKAIFEDRIDWWLEAGGDDVFTLGTTFALPDSMVSFIRLLTMPGSDWEKTREKQRAPKPRTDFKVLHVATCSLQKRMEVYKTSIEEDEALLSDAREDGIRKRMAVVVRLGEKRILRGALNAVKAQLVESADNKRKHIGDGDQPKRDKRMKS